MKRFKSLALCLTAVSAVCVHTVAGQTNAPAVQTDARVLGKANAPARVVRPTAPALHGIARAPAGLGARTINSAPATNGQSSINLRPGYSPFQRPLNPTLAAMSARQTARTYDEQPITRTPAGSDIAQNAVPPITNPQRIARAYNLQRTRNILTRRELAQGSPRTTNPQSDGKALQPISENLTPHETLQSGGRHGWRARNDRLSYSDALRCHRHEWHNRDWWRRNCTTIVFVNSGYYFLDAGYWYPAWGYDSLSNYYDYDGPIYTYGNLLPDEVIANVQVALQDAGFYFGAITGSLNVETRAALANFQREYGLPITGAIDQPTIETLGLY